MNKFIAKVFKSAGVNAKVSKDSENPRFKVTENQLTLEGVIKNDKYIMKIKDTKGKLIDNISVSVSNSNDIVNRINESINTLKMLSTAYDNRQLKEEAEEFDDVVVDENEPDNLIDGLSNLYNAILDVAEQAESLCDLADEDDAEQLSNIIGFSSSLYDCAIDVDDYKEDVIEEQQEEVEESYTRTKTSKGSARKAIDNLTLAESLLRKNKDTADIAKAIKDIKSELIVRGF
jgi:signal recognition particle subunit SEC65